MLDATNICEVAINSVWKLQNTVESINNLAVKQDSLVVVITLKVKTEWKHKKNKIQD